MFYKFLQLFFTTFFRLFFRVQIQGAENLPLTGPVILAANHCSNWDPPFLAAYLKRPVGYMAKQELFEVPVLGWAITQCHSFPVKRGAADRSAIKAAVQALREENCIGLFPEGTRSKDGRLHKAEAGVALIAAMTKAPVVPAAIIGTAHLFPHGGLFSRVTVIYGRPMFFEGQHHDKAALQVFSQKIMDEIARMINLDSKDA